MKRIIYDSVTNKQYELHTAGCGEAIEVRPVIDGIVRDEVLTEVPTSKLDEITEHDVDVVLTAVRAMAKPAAAPAAVPDETVRNRVLIGAGNERALLLRLTQNGNEIGVFLIEADEYTFRDFIKETCGADGKMTVESLDQIDFPEAQEFLNGHKEQIVNTVRKHGGAVIRYEDARVVAVEPLAAAA